MREHVKREFLKRGLSKPKQLSFPKMSVRSLIQTVTVPADSIRVDSWSPVATFRTADLIGSARPASSLFEQRRAEEVGNGIRQSARAIGANHRQRQLSCQAMPLDAKLLKDARAPLQGMFGKDRMAKARFHKPLDGFGVVSLHLDMWPDADLLEECVDDPPHVASFRIKKKWPVIQFRGPYGANITAGGSFC